MAQGRFALELLSRDHLKLAFPWLRGLSQDQGLWQFSGVIILLLGNRSTICSSRSEVRDETSATISMNTKYGYMPWELFWGCFITKTRFEL